MKKKLKAAVVIIVMLIAISIGAFAAQSVTTIILYKPEVPQGIEVTGEDMDLAESVIRERLDMNGYTEAKISREDTGLRVEIPKADLSEEDIESMGKAAKLEFLDADGNVIMDGSKTYVKRAAKMYGDSIGSNVRQYYVELEFTREGQKAFADATEAAAARIGENKNYITVALDGEAQLSPSVRERIDSDSCVITGNYTSEEAGAVANLINSGSLPFTLKAVEIEKIEETQELNFFSMLKLLIEAHIPKIFR